MKLQDQYIVAYCFVDNGNAGTNEFLELLFSIFFSLGQLVVGAYQNFKAYRIIRFSANQYTIIYAHYAT